MKLYVLDLGKIIMRGENPVISADHDGGEEPAIPIHAFLLDTPAGKILFDTGCHPQAMGGGLALRRCVPIPMCREKGENCWNGWSRSG